MRIFSPCCLYNLFTLCSYPANKFLKLIFFMTNWNFAKKNRTSMNGHWTQGCLSELVQNSCDVEQRAQRITNPVARSSLQIKLIETTFKIHRFCRLSCLQIKRWHNDKLSCFPFGATCQIADFFSVSQLRRRSQILSFPLL